MKSRDFKLKTFPFKAQDKTWLLVFTSANPQNAAPGLAENAFFLFPWELEKCHGFPQM